MKHELPGQFDLALGEIGDIAAHLDGVELQAGVDLEVRRGSAARNTSAGRAD